MVNVRCPVVAEPIECKAAVSWGPKEKLVIETITVAPPKSNEVRVKLTATGVCHTDWFTMDGHDPEGLFPCVFGHEGAGVVESIGEGVTNVDVGDHVILLYTAECFKCKFCLNPKTNLCQSVRATQGKGVMPDGTSRFTCRGKPLYHYMGCSTFAEYTVVADVSVVAIRKDAPLEKVCLFACGVTTGIGAVRYTTNVEKGSSVGVWGIGAVGLACVAGAAERGASRIVVVDTNPSKFKKAIEFGATDCVNPLDLDSGKTVQQHIVEMTDGGLDYTFECIGNVNTMRAALESSHKGWGVSCVIGVAGAGQEIATRPFMLVTGRSWVGSAFGGVRGRSQMPGIIDEYCEKKGAPALLDEFISNTYNLNGINDAFKDMISGLNLRGIIHF